jgi:hypothetical protein|tara:strand:+ start:605 stop:901 length:297 start_codon:yes stop_codon:yes gene_type:complete
VDIKEIKEKFNLPVSRGAGKSIDSPIIIDYNVKNYVELEYFIISKLIKINDKFVCERSNQKLLKYKDRTIDYLKFKIIKKKTSSIKYEEFYFDITNVY